MLCQTRAQLADAPVKLPRLHDLAEKAGRQRLLGRQVLRQQQHPLGARSAPGGQAPRLSRKTQEDAPAARAPSPPKRRGGRAGRRPPPPPPPPPPPMANPSITASVGTGSVSTPARMPSIFSS